MEQDREIPRPGEFYRHFKNKMYQIVAVAVHSETGERMVVYQALYGNFLTWVRPLSMFMEKVDREKYPDAGQIYRFERAAPGEASQTGETAAGGVSARCEEPVKSGETAPQENGVVAAREDGGQVSGQAPNPLLSDFFDAEGYNKKLECLARLKDRVTQRDLDLICLAMDMKPQAGDLPDQLRAVRSQLLMLQKFDGERLR